MRATRTPVLFFPGLWIHSESWTPWIHLFADAGYQPVSPGWPGEAPTVEQTRRDPRALADLGLGAVVDHYRQLIDRMDTRPLIVGHSFGGAVAEKLLGLNRAAAAIAIGAVQIQGVTPLPFSILRSGFSVLKNPTNSKRALCLTPDQFRYSFGNAVNAQESDQLHHRWSIPGPGKPLLKVATRKEYREPLLLIAGGKDHTVPSSMSKATLRQYRHSKVVAELKTFADRGHSLTKDHGWREIAEFSVTWFQEKGHQPAVPGLARLQGPPRVR